MEPLRNYDVRSIKNQCKDIGLAENTVKARIMEVGHHRGVMANWHIMVGNTITSLGKAKVFNKLGFLLRNKSSIHEKIKYRIKVGN